jgi:hypothetical protein
MVQATDLWDGDDVTQRGWLYRTTLRAILIEREMGSRAVVVIEVRGQDAMQMSLVEDDDVIQTLAPN